MKKAFIVVILMMCSLGIFAQQRSWYFSFLPGYQFDSSAANFPGYTGKNGSMKPLAGLVASFDGEYLYSEHIGLHMGLIYEQGKFRENVLIIHFPPPRWAEGDFESSYGIFEVGPEFVASLSHDDQLYFQVNVGVTFAHESYQTYGGSSDATFRNGATYGAAIGYRHFFGERIGIAAQLAYHKVNEWKTDHVDVRVGAVFRF